MPRQTSPRHRCSRSRLPQSFGALSTAAQRRLAARHLAADRAEAREIFKQLIEINTTDTPRGSVTAATKAMQKRFLDAGFPPEDVHLLGPDPNKQNLVVRIRAAAPDQRKSPSSFSATSTWSRRYASDWHTDPFQFVEKDGYFYGRGTQDMKDSDAALVFTFLRLHREGYKPKRDLILALTADEEGGKFNGAAWLVNESSRPGRRGLRHQSRCRRSGTRPRPRHRRGRGSNREGLRGLPGHGQQSRRPQFAAAARQRHLRTHHGSEQAGRLQLSV